MKVWSVGLRKKTAYLHAAVEKLEAEVAKRVVAEKEILVAKKGVAGDF